MGIWCQTGSGLLRLKGALIGKCSLALGTQRNRSPLIGLSLLTCTEDDDPLILQPERTSLAVRLFNVCL